MTARGGLSDAELARLMNEMREGPRPTAPAALPASPAHDALLSFSTLPRFAELRTQSAAAEVLGIENPYHRLHEARAGAVSRMAGREIVNFASYDYLGLNGDPRITRAVVEAAEAWGTSVSASRLSAGERPAHRALEEALAGVYAAEDALAFVSGHATPLAVLPTLMGPKDLIVTDALMHNSVVLGAQYSGATRRSFPHNDLDALEAMLARDRDHFARVLLISEGLFSMDGDGPDLKRLVALKQRFGCWLMIDDAHGLGVLGRTGRGLAEHQSVDPRGVDIWFGTLSKTLVSCGGYIAGPSALIAYLKAFAPGMVYSVGLPVPVAEAARTALAILLEEPGRVAHLQANSIAFRDGAAAAGFDVGTSWGTGIVPVMVGETIKTVLLAQKLLERGINAFPVLPPGVPDRSARLRFFISAAHRPEHLDAALYALREEGARLGIVGF
ncbi:aminotransferase class I/II-fold pyridoxal phosphate-dependent enzyme [Xanthobacter dioxanivorans]|uniref:Aminotransferase class I/II-fold pyridoxal phosphate-dependent enzyme n=1 Tax=Xanthobacter dioxanivorans TaxID=2528964 RepID=A0A974SHM3_9HYPH|nr:aminotransferase class I/II-fold pyridoxal phosphate-dependent enzyme [Xanthobacter dioxanivorans]QRG05274.1 aminotransferase class I/II-fold pyridoxal phosphate-dependent enzyme [Xanthobacter dioxanivorans]